MNRELPVKFFKGLEIEKTNHFLEPTMIAPGQYDVEKCLEMIKAHNCTHILLGYMYDPSGKPLDMDLDKAFACAEAIMDAGFRVTLEIRPDQITEEFAQRCPDPAGKYGKLFVVLVGTAFPHFHKLKHYTTMKFHDDYKTSQNGGVWCVPATMYEDHGQFTQWNAYIMDEHLE